MKGHIIIGGGSGFIGKHLTRLLKNMNFDVTVVSRCPKQGEMSWGDVEAIGLPGNTTAVVNLAGQNILDMKHRWSDDFKKLVWNSRISTTNLLNRVVTNSGVPVSAFVVMSGVGIYKPSDKAEYSEDSIIKEHDFLSKMCMEIEKASKLSSELETRPVIIRCGVVLGRDGGMIKNLYVPFYLGLGGPVLPGYQPLPWIHVNDVCRLIAFGIENKHIQGVLNGVAPQQTTNEDFAKAFGQALHRPAVIPLPGFVLRLMFQERAEMITTGQIVKPNRPISLGFQYLFPDIESACKDIVNPPKLP